MRFIFPVDEERYRKVQSSAEVKELFKKEADENGLGYQYFRIVVQKNKKNLYCLCTKCPARLYYKWDQNIYRLSLFRNNHDHQQIPRLAILQYMKSLPGSITSISQKQLVMQRFNISANQYYYLRKKKMNCSQNPFVLSDLKKYFQAERISYSIGPPDQKGNPEFIYLVSQNMRQSYSKYGFCIKIDFTFGLFQNKYVLKNPETSQISQSPYTLGLISGSNNMNHLLIYGLCICPGEKKQYVKGFLTYFFATTGSQCDSIISDMGQSIRGGIADLKAENLFSGNLLFDVFHFFRSIKIKGQQKWEIIKKMHTCSKADYLYYVEQLKQQCQYDELSEINKLRRFQTQIFFNSIPPQFVGTSITSSGVQKINDLIKKDIPFAINLYSGLMKIIRLSHKINQRSQSKVEFQSSPIQDFVHIKGIEFLRSSMSRSPFLFLTKQISQALSLNARKDQVTGKIIVTERESMDFMVQYDSDLERHVCECLFYDKTFMPCRHIAKVVKDIAPQVGKFWLIEDKTGFQQIGNRYLRRKTRRNRMQ